MGFKITETHTLGTPTRITTKIVNVAGSGRVESKIVAGHGIKNVYSMLDPHTRV